MKYLKSTQLHCFSPPVMIATFVIEIALAIYVTWRYKLNAITRLAVAILFFLSLFQLAEYNICEGSFGVDSASWARLGYVAITTLPPLGFHLATRLAGKSAGLPVALAYASGIFFMVFFAVVGHGIQSQVCGGNYVIFNVAANMSMAYGWYYYGWLIVATAYCYWQAQRAKTIHIARSLRALMVGYLSFILPTTTANLIDPMTLKAIPSIMCGFAVLLAIILAGEVLPQYFHRTSISDVFNGAKMRGKVIK